MPNTYAFDDCSILKLCSVHIPAAFQAFFHKTSMTAKNGNNVKALIDKLEAAGYPKYRFVPSENMEGNIIKVANQLLEGYNIRMLPPVFKYEVIGQLKEFNGRINEEFLKINKDENIEGIKQMFKQSIRELSKQDSMPQDDDLKIIQGYCKFECAGDKYLITEDEHFWGYADLILKRYNIYVVKEWEGHTLSIS